KNIKYNLFHRVIEVNPEVEENLLLNFNYTTYYLELPPIFKGRYDNQHFQCLNIHGGLFSDPDDIVFGLGDEQDDFYLEVESRYGDEWLQCMKSFYYFRNDFYQEL